VKAAPVGDSPPQQELSWVRTRRWGRTLLPCVLVFALLVPTLDAQSLWWDESISLHLALSSWAELLRDR